MHHLLCWQSVSEKYKESLTTYAYVNTQLVQLIMDADHLKLIAHGHTHESFRYTMIGTEVICNPRGYPNENPEWKPVEFNIEI